MPVFMVNTPDWHYYDGFYTSSLLLINWRSSLTDEGNTQTFEAKKLATFVTVCQIDVKKLQMLFSAFKMLLLQITK